MIATVMGKHPEKGFFPGQEKSANFWVVREVWKGLKKSGNIQINQTGSLLKTFIFRKMNELSSEIVQVHLSRQKELLLQERICSLEVADSFV